MFELKSSWRPLGSRDYSISEYTLHVLPFDAKKLRGGKSELEPKGLLPCTRCFLPQPGRGEEEKRGHVRTLNDGHIIACSLCGQHVQIALMYNSVFAVWAHRF